jgi:hypothetical protein
MIGIFQRWGWGFHFGGGVEGGNCSFQMGFIYLLFI